MSNSPESTDVSGQSHDRAVDSPESTGDGSSQGSTDRVRGSVAADDGNPLERLGDWPVDNVAAAVVTPNGITHTYGPPDRRFRLASVSKPLFAYSVLIAVEEETLALDDPAGPEGSTVEHLLSHASGLGLDGGELARPGRRRIYSNTGFDVLGRTLATGCGFDVATYLEESVLLPLGMSDTALEGSPASDVYSTVADLSRWVGELFTPTLVSEATFGRATSVAFPGLDGMVPGYGKQSPNDWGLGFEIKSTKSPHWTAPGGSPRTFGHFGRAGTFVWLDPDVETALVVLTDRDFDSWALPLWPAVSQAVLDLR